MDKNYVLSPMSLDEIASAVAQKIKGDMVGLVPAPAEADELLTVKEVAKLLQVSLVTIHTWKREGKLKFYRYGSRIRFKKSEVLQVEKYPSTKSKKAL